MFGHSEWCDDNNGYELIEDFDNNEIIDELYDLEDGIEDEDGMITDSDLDDWDDDDEDEVYDLEDDVHDDEPIIELVLLTLLFCGMAVFSIVLMKSDGDNNENK